MTNEDVRQSAIDEPLSLSLPGLSRQSRTSRRNLAVWRRMPGTSPGMTNEDVRQSAIGEPLSLSLPGLSRQSRTSRRNPAVWHWMPGTNLGCHPGRVKPEPGSITPARHMAVSLWTPAQDRGDIMHLCLFSIVTLGPVPSGHAVQKFTTRRVLSYGQQHKSGSLPLNLHLSAYRHAYPIHPCQLKPV